MLMKILKFINTILEWFGMVKMDCVLFQVHIIIVSYYIMRNGTKIIRYTTQVVIM